MPWMRPLVAALAAMLAALSVAGCSGPDDAAHGMGGRGPVPVLVATATRKSVARRLGAIGRVEAYSTVQVKAQISGEVTEVHFKEGQDLRKGDALFTIDPRPYEAALIQAQADLERDQAQMEQARADYGRYSTLLREKVGSRSQYDDAKAKFDALRATTAADEANVQTAKLNLGYTDIRSPIDGRTGTLLLHQGNLVKANADTAMVVINQLKPVYVDFSLPEQDLRGGAPQHGGPCARGRGRDTRRYRANRARRAELRRQRRRSPTPVLSSSRESSITTTNSCGPDNSWRRG